jgi:hypothetical protein
VIGLRRREVPQLGVDESLHVDPRIFDDEAWLAWAKEHMSSREFALMERAIESDGVWPWELRARSLLQPEDHAEMLDVRARIVAAFDELGAAA